MSNLRNHLTTTVGVVQPKVKLTGHTQKKKETEEGTEQIDLELHPQDEEQVNIDVRHFGKSHA